MAKDNGNEIPEIVLTPDQLEVLEIGGARRMDIANITTLCKYSISNIVAVNTAWGTRIDFTLKDDWGEYILSDWNIQMKRRIKALDLLGKEITLEPSKNPKKVVLNVLG